MDYLKEVIDAIKPVLKQYGFVKKQLNWIKHNEYITKVFKIQKSQYSPKVYLNFGISINEINDKPVSSCNQCQIFSRFDDLIDNKFLDFEIEIDPHLRANAFISLLQSNPYNFFTLNGTKEELVAFIKDNNILPVFLSAKKYLGIE